ncbi:MAG TPA: iron-containing redox enzyme family protein [Acidimicrobiales bacterium]|nr:iron-containing redox enzyme family protein [Acidimicrobiales bacterium]
MTSTDAATGGGRVLRRKIELVSPVLRAAGHRLLAHPRVDAVYCEYLFASHFVVRASVPLMEAALRQAQTMDDPLARRLTGYLRSHIAEELHHDQWLLEDLESLGVERAGVLARPPPAAVAALVGAQYYWTLHYHPIAVLAYMAVLEGHPPSPEQIDLLMKRTGFPPRAFRTLTEHAVLDPGHGDDIFAMLDELSLSEDLSAVLGVSAMHTVVALAEAIEAVVGAVPSTGHLL